MSYIAAILGAVGGIAGGAGSYFGGQAAASGAEFSVGHGLAAGFDPRADPLLALLNAQALATLGITPDRNVLMAASPVNRLENNLLNSLGDDVRERDLQVLNEAIRALHAGSSADEVRTILLTLPSGQIAESTRPWKALNLALSSGGYDSLADLITQEQAYQTQADVYTASLQGPAESRAASRTAANLSIDQILGNYPVFTSQNLDQEIARAMEPLRAQELERANALGYNPSTNIALTQQQGIRDALAILSGRQGLSNTALGALQGGLGAQTSEALAISGQNLGSITNSSNLASQQALALSQLNAQGQLASAQATGSGIQGLFGGIGSGLSTAALLSYFERQPGDYSYYGGGRGGGSESF